MISSLASISSDAKIAENARIDSFSTIFEDVVIGKNSHIHPNVTIYPGTRIGENCEIFPGAVIGVIPQDLKFDGEYTTVEIGNNTKIRECVTIHRGTKDKWKTSIGDNCLLMTYVHVAHDCQIGNDVPPYIKAAREPLTFAGVNSVGLRRRGFSDEMVRQIEDIYRILYVQNSNLTKGISAVKEVIEDCENRNEILSFIESSDKGVIRGMI